MLAALLCGCGGPRYSSTRGASLERFKLHSTLLATPVWLDGGSDDPFRSADRDLARILHIRYHVWPGGHDSAYWSAHMPAYLRFYSGELARCRTGSQ
jgi:enterochelin esterase-like enzyme